MDAFHSLIAAFNRGSLDVPAGFFTPRTTFSLNNRTYESILGGSPERGGGPAISDDPLIGLLARGVAGYRTAAKALQYALLGAAVSADKLSEPDAHGVRVATVRIEGQLRHSAAPFLGHARIRFTVTDGALAAVEVSCPEDEIAQLAAARR